MEAILLIAGLITAAAWGVYLIPNISSGRRAAPLSSTEQFDRWTHVMADVQSRSYTMSKASARNVVRRRRRRTLTTLIVTAVAALVAAIALTSIGWLIAHLALDAVIAWYVGMLLQVKQREAARVANEHFQSQAPGTAEPPVRIVAGH